MSFRPIRRAMVSAILCCVVLTGTIGLSAEGIAETIPLPEHPRPDFYRRQWLNLNGEWHFRFDRENVGEARRWGAGTTEFTERIIVPFPWGSKASRIENRGDIGWYQRTLRVPESWKGQRIFVVVGACDWLTKGWIDGKFLGEHRGGYTPFELEITSHVEWGRDQQLVLRVDDTPHPFKLEGKQGYGEAKGIWQTIYLEMRPSCHVTTLHFTPNIDAGNVSVNVGFSSAAPSGAKLDLRFKNHDATNVSIAVDPGATKQEFNVPMAGARWWSLDDPYLYEVEAAFTTSAGEDRLESYFGMRKISVEKLPGTDFPYVALNGKPVYLQMCLDQSYHPDGFYTFPTDEFMRDEILRSKRIGLNTNRIHIKAEVPRKLYWADRLGLLIMADLPNFWGNPTPEAQAESEYALRQMIHRDFNHPAIFSWVTFNETWGLFTKSGEEKTYLPATQAWAAAMYRLAKHLDPTRLVEDNSPCNYDHTETDLNSWHDYLPGYAWRDRLDEITRATFPGSKWNFIGGRVQGSQPLLNSECGNVWGYEGSTGDVDWTWDYHIMMNEFRRHPKIGGWLYTEHHDVINEWNGYYRFDRSEKYTGMDSLNPGMTLADLHSPLYLSTGSDLCREVKPGESVEVPLYASFLTDRAPGRGLTLRWQLSGWNSLGQETTYGQGKRPIVFEPWMSRELDPLKLTMPNAPALVVLSLDLENDAGAVLHRNFTTFLIANGVAPRSDTIASASDISRVLRFAPNTFTSAKWSAKQWNVLEGLKVNGAGSGYFEYRLPWPADLDPRKVAGATLVFEASAKQLFRKDRTAENLAEGDFMRGKGTHDPSANPNSYPMTDSLRYPSQVRVRVNGIAAGSFTLPDDPADHRGILSWHAQPRDKRLREAGSYGYLIHACLAAESLHSAAEARELVVRLEVDEATGGGLALYGERFGRYPMDPTIVFELHE